MREVLWSMQCKRRKTKGGGGSMPCVLMCCLFDRLYSAHRFLFLSLSRHVDGSQ